MTDYEKIVKWERENSSGEGSVFVTKLVKGGLTYSQILVVLNAVDTTCLHCFDGDKHCNCRNDE
jgi:hypothetical protein